MKSLKFFRPVNGMGINGCTSGNIYQVAWGERIQVQSNKCEFNFNDGIAQYSPQNSIVSFHKPALASTTGSALHDNQSCNTIFLIREILDSDIDRILAKSATIITNTYLTNALADAAESKLIKGLFGMKPFRMYTDGSGFNITDFIPAYEDEYIIPLKWKNYFCTVKQSDLPIILNSLP